MPKIIELTVEIDVQKVSCPGVWLCQDGRVSLTVFALGTSYQTCLLPPVFPLLFKDVFYFRKRFQETCALNNICCLLKDETIYCELVQWCNDCMSGECTVLAQYLGALNDVLFPPNMCSSDGVDLLMRRSKEFPGILSPKIEIATKVRIDEVWNQPCNLISSTKIKSCQCSAKQDIDGYRQKQVCHSAQYHRNKCSASRKCPSRVRSRSRSRSGGSTSCCSLTTKELDTKASCVGSNPVKSRITFQSRPRHSRRCATYSVYNVQTPAPDDSWRGATMSHDSGLDTESSIETEKEDDLPLNEDRMQKIILKSRYIEQDISDSQHKSNENTRKYDKMKLTPCVCEICRRYHELFHTNYSKS